LCGEHFSCSLPIEQTPCSVSRSSGYPLVPPHTAAKVFGRNTCSGPFFMRDRLEKSASLEGHCLCAECQLLTLVGLR
jgi:hypothetical protein